MTAGIVRQKRTWSDLFSHPCSTDARYHSNGIHISRASPIALLPPIMPGSGPYTICCPAVARPNSPPFRPQKPIDSDYKDKQAYLVAVSQKQGSQRGHHNQL